MSIELAKYISNTVREVVKYYPSLLPDRYVTPLPMSQRDRCWTVYYQALIGELDTRKLNRSLLMHSRGMPPYDEVHIQIQHVVNKYLQDPIVIDLLLKHKLGVTNE